MKIKLINYRTKLRECDLPTRVPNFLKKAKVKTIKDLFELWNRCGEYRIFQQEITKIKGLGSVSAYCLYNFMMERSVHIYE